MLHLDCTLRCWWGWWHPRVGHRQIQSNLENVWISKLIKTIKKNCHHNSKCFSFCQLSSTWWFWNAGHRWSEIRMKWNPGEVRSRWSKIKDEARSRWSEIQMKWDPDEVRSRNYKHVRFKLVSQGWLLMWKMYFLPYAAILYILFDVWPFFCDN